VNKAEAKRVACALVVNAATLNVTPEAIAKYAPKVGDREKVDDALTELFMELSRRAEYRPRD
jgi:hypothetical protein